MGHFTGHCCVEGTVQPYPFYLYTSENFFESPLFLDYQRKLLAHIKKIECVEDESIEKCLPGVLKKMDDTNEAIKQINDTLKKDREDAKITKTNGDATINTIEKKG